MPKSKKQSKPLATNHEPRAVNLTWLPKKTFELIFTIPWKKAKKAYDRVLKEVATKTTIKGFRKGKAPLGLVEKSLDKAKLYEEVIKSLLPETYGQAIKQHNLNPIVLPKIEVIALKEGEDWQFKAKACEKPEIKLGNYQQIVKGELNKSKIWTPDKGQPEKKGETEPSEQKIKTVTKALLDNVKVEIPEILLENEVNRMLSQLLDQVNSLGMTIQQYLASKGITQEKLRRDFWMQAQETLKLEFILQEIVREQNIKVTPEEIEKMIKAIPDQNSRKAFDNPQEKAYISLVIAKRKAIDYLLSL